MFGVVIRQILALFSAALVLVAPAHAQVEPPPLEAYGTLPGVEDLALSPSGNRIAMLATVASKRTIIVTDDQLKALRSFPVGEIKVRGLWFIDDDHLLVIRSSTEDLGIGFVQDKFEFSQALVIEISTGEVSLIFGNRGALVSAIFGYYGTRIVEGKPIAYFGGIELQRETGNRTAYSFVHGRPGLYAVDLLENSPRRAHAPPGPGEDRDWLIGADGQVSAKLDRSDTTGSWTISGSRGIVAKGTQIAGRVYLISLGKDGSTAIYSASDDATGETKWYEVPLDGSKPPEEVFANTGVERIFTDRRTGHLIGYVRDGLDSDPVFVDPEIAAKVKKVRQAFARFNNRMIDWTPGFDQVIVRVRGNDESGAFYTVDLAELRAEPIGWERPLIGPENVGPISTFGYTASDGLGMDGILTLPPDREAKGLPVVMLPHGGPHSHDIETFDWWAQAYASRGYAVFQPNFRGSTNRDESFVQAGYGEWGGKMQSDISDGLAALAEKGIVDPSRACIVGASYGGYAALAGVTLQQGLYRCAVSVNGVSDVSLMSRIERRESGDSKVAARSLERQLGPRSLYREISPRHNAEKADAPILLIHGRDDTVVAYDQSLKMADALKDAGKPYEFVELEGEDHWLSLGETRKAMLAAAMEFVQRHNPAD